MYGMDGRAVEETLPAICTPIRVMDLEEEAEHCSTNMIALLFLHGIGTDTRGGEAVLICLFDCVFFLFRSTLGDAFERRGVEARAPKRKARCFCQSLYY